MDKKIIVAFSIFCYEESKTVPHMVLIKKATNLTMPTLSHAMKCLMADGIITSKKEGRKVFYSLTPKGEKWVKALRNADTIYRVFSGGGIANEKDKR